MRSYAFLLGTLSRIANYLRFVKRDLRKDEAFKVSASPAIDKKTVLVRGLYLSNYDKIVKPQQRFLIPNYFINYWVGRLGPTLSWIIVALQQGCWREDSDQYTISQAAIAEEIGLERRTVGRVINENPFRHWYIPNVEYRKGIVDHVSKSYQPLPYKYTVYLSLPLIPEHLAGLSEYLQQECSTGNPGAVEQAVDKLLEMKGKDALALLEKYHRSGTNWDFESSVSLTEVVRQVTALNLKDLTTAQATALDQKLAGLHAHLTEIGYTNCRQYFRLKWVPILGPALAWLVMGLRSRGYYNPETGEHRDVCTWRKKELAALLGQSRYNLRLLLSHPDADHFFQIIKNEKQKITVRVSLIQDPLVTESAAEFWSRQSALENVEKYDMTPPENVEKSDITSPKTLKKVTSPPENVELYDTYKYFEKSVLINNDDDDDDDKKKDRNTGEQKNYLSPTDTMNMTNLKLRQLLSQAGLSGTGLDKLCDRSPPLDFQHVRAVLLYAEARGLGPGYIYRHLESDATVDEPFRQLARLDDETLNLFRQGVSELKANGTIFSAAIQTPIPEHQAKLFARFAEIFAGIKAEVALAALPHNGAAPDDSGQEIEKASLTDQGRAELELLWSQILAQLRMQMTQGTFDTWLTETRLLARHGPRLTVAVKNGFAKEWLENRLYSTIRRAVERLFEAEDLLENPDVEIEFVVDEMG